MHPSRSGAPGVAWTGSGVVFVPRAGIDDPPARGVDPPASGVDPPVAGVDPLDPDLDPPPSAALSRVEARTPHVPRERARDREPLPSADAVTPPRDAQSGGGSRASRSWWLRVSLRARSRDDRALHSGNGPGSVAPKRMRALVPTRTLVANAISECLPSWPALSASKATFPSGSPLTQRANAT